jgi:RNA polymerase sigma factor (sigma-70 family)
MKPLFKRKNQLTDNQLVLEFIESDKEEYLGELYLRYHHLVYLVCQKYLCNSEDSKDAVIDIFEKLQRTIKNHDIRNFQNWLHVVTKNHCLMKIRMPNPIVLKDPKVLEKIFMENGDLYHLTYEQEVQKDELEVAFSQLNKAQRLCLEMFYYRNKTYKEIATETGYEINQVKSHIQNGKRNLKNLLLKQ